MKKNKKLEQLKFYYLLVFILGAIVIIPTHLFPPPTFMYARFPHYLEMMSPLLGFSWPETFKIYHYVIYALAITGILNVLGIIFYSKLRKIAILSSGIGIILISLMILFLFLKFTNVNAPTAIVYGLYSVVLLIVDFLTFKTLTIKRKEA